MPYSLLSPFAHRVQLDRPLPFSVYAPDHTLLLARGQHLDSADQLKALLKRGVMVDIDEVLAPARRARTASRRELPGLWNEYRSGLADALRSPGTDSFRQALDEAAPAVMALVSRDSDLAIFQVLQQDSNAHVQYGVNHSIHAAIAAQLVAQRLGWSEDETQRAFKAALTMNVSMLELQGQLAEQTTPPTEEQRAAIRSHPELSRMMLEAAGVTDAELLEAVATHHESPDGRGYPLGLREVNDVSALVRRADIYTAKLSARRNRSAMDADVAGRQMFMQDPGHPMTAALVKEFGVYPPGCWVRLASGECGLVVRRGATVMAPIVSVMTAADGSMLAQPIERDTNHKHHAVRSVLDAKQPLRRLPSDLLVKLAVA